MQSFKLTPKGKKHLLSLMNILAQDVLEKDSADDLTPYQKQEEPLVS